MKRLSLSEIARLTGGRLHGADWYVGLRDRFQVPRQTLAGWHERTRTDPEGELS